MHRKELILLVVARQRAQAHSTQCTQAATIVIANSRLRCGDENAKICRNVFDSFEKWRISTSTFGIATHKCINPNKQHSAWERKSQAKRTTTQPDIKTHVLWTVMLILSQITDLWKSVSKGRSLICIADLCAPPKYTIHYTLVRKFRLFVYVWFGIWQTFIIEPPRRLFARSIWLHQPSKNHCIWKYFGKLLLRQRWIITAHIHQYIVYSNDCDSCVTTASKANQWFPSNQHTEI